MMKRQSFFYGFFLFFLSWASLSFPPTDCPTFQAVLNGWPMGGIYVYETALYTTWSPFFITYDLSQGYPPRYMGYTLLSDRILKVLIFEEYALILTEDGNLSILSLEDPLHPQKVQEVELPGVTDLYIHNGFLFTNGYAIRIWDIHKLPAIELLGKKIMRKAYYSIIGVIGSFLYIEKSGAIEILSLRPLSNIHEVGRIEDRDFQHGFTRGNMLYGITKDGYLCVYDASDPLIPSLIGCVPFFDKVSQHWVQDHYLFIKYDAGGYHFMEIWNLSEGSMPKKVGEMEQSYLYALAFQENTLFCAYGNRGLRIYDISNPANEVLLFEGMTIPYHRVVASDGTFLYTADNQGHFYVFAELSGDVLHPIATLDLPPPPQNAPSLYLNQMIFDAPYVYIGSNLFLFIVDVQNPYSPQLVYTLDFQTLDDYYYAGDMKKAGSYLFLSNNIHGLDIFDISQRDNPVFVTSYPYFFTTFAVNDGYLYGSTYSSAAGYFIVLDIRNILEPKEVWREVVEHYFTDMEVYHQHLFALDDTYLFIYSLDDPFMPTLYYKDFSFGRYLTIQDDYLFIFSWKMEPYILIHHFWPLPLPMTPPWRTQMYGFETLLVEQYLYLLSSSSMVFDISCWMEQATLPYIPLPNHRSESPSYNLFDE